MPAASWSGSCIPARSSDRRPARSSGWKVRWPVVRAAAGLMVPTTAVVTTTERTFVIRVAAGKAEWVTVKKGAVTGDQVEVAGALAVGDTLVRRGTDEMRPGTAIK